MMALDVYRQIHALFPDNIECLKFLVRIATDLGMKEVSQYTELLRKAEKARDQSEARQTSAERKGRSRSGRARSGRTGSGSAGSAKAHGNLHRRDGEAVPPAPPSELPSQTAGREAVSASYADPIGAAPARPKTAAQRVEEQDEWDDMDLGDDMLPD